jgi:hypothetical protein
LDNKDLMKQIEDLRKEKLAASTMLENLKNRFDQLCIEKENTMKSNDEAKARIKIDMLSEVEREGMDEKKEFENQREILEEKYHEIIEENIKREREHKKELSRKRTALGSLAASVMSEGTDGENTININNLTEEQQMKLLEDEDISDRTPILDILIEKWRYYNKFKKQILDRYTKNAISIKDAFDKMMKYLGIDNYEELPIVLEKMEEQMSSIEIFISKLTNEIDFLEEKKRLIEYKIQSLSLRLNSNFSEKTSFQENKNNNIHRLKSHIAELKEDIERKRQFFTKLQPLTDDFLIQLDETYISEYIPGKVAINKDVIYNESNIIEVLANVQDYQKLIEEFDKSSQQLYDKRTDNIINKDIEKLKQEMRAKLERFDKDSCINNNFYSSIKNEVKMNTSFDETIKKMADEIIKTVNQQNLTKEASLGKKKTK